MATGTDGGHGQAAFEQALPVNAVHIVAQNVALGNIARQLNRSAFLMTTSAELGDLDRGGRRTLGRWPQDVMGAVAALATGGQRVAPFHSASMQTGGKLRRLVRVAAPAIDRRELLGVRKLLRIDVGVAVGAFK